MIRGIFRRDTFGSSVTPSRYHHQTVVQKPTNKRNVCERVDIKSKINVDLRFGSRLEIQGKVSVDIRNENIAIHIVYDEQ